MGNSCQSRGTGLVSQPLWQLSVFHCRAANALRHARIAVIKRILKQKQNVRQSKLASGCHSLAPRATTRQTHECMSSVTPPPHTSTLKEWAVFYFHLSFSKHSPAWWFMRKLNCTRIKKSVHFRIKMSCLFFKLWARFLAWNVCRSWNSTLVRRSCGCSPGTVCDTWHPSNASMRSLYCEAVRQTMLTSSVQDHPRNNVMMLKILQ